MQAGKSVAGRRVLTKYQRQLLTRDITVDGVPLTVTRVRTVRGVQFQALARDADEIVRLSHGDTLGPIRCTLREAVGGCLLWHAPKRAKLHPRDVQELSLGSVVR